MDSTNDTSLSELTIMEASAKPVELSSDSSPDKVRMEGQLDCDGV